MRQANYAQLGVHLGLIGTLCLVLATLSGAPPRASAQQPTIDVFTINNDSGNQRAPRVSGKWVVFEDDRRQGAATATPTATTTPTATSTPTTPTPTSTPTLTPTPTPTPTTPSPGVDIFSWNSDTKRDRRLTDNPTAFHPAVSGSLAVWAEPSTSQGLDIVVYDLEAREIRRRIERAGDQDFPAISGNRVVWQENSGGSWGVFGYDLDKKEFFTVSDASGDQTHPAIDGDLVAFEDARDSTIWYRDLKSNRLQKIEARGGWEPSVSGNRIVFRSGGSRDNPENANIFVFDVSTGTLSDGLATTLDGKRGNPRISGDLAVWWDTRSGDRDIYGYDLGSKTEIKILGDSGDQDEPDVSSNVVVWTDHRGSDSDVRGARVTLAQATATPTATVATTPTLGPTPAPPGGQAPRDARFFSQTGFRVDNDRFWEYFQLRGGVRTFGYPISRTFSFLGFTVQFFQGHIMQLQADGRSVATMNLLQEGLMPATRVNASVFPPPDPAIINSTPKVGQPNYANAIVDFTRQNAPNDLGGRPVRFFDTFVGTVDLATAFPGGGGDAALLPLLNLEIWGAVTSRPMADPTNPDFVYQRYQRGIMHYREGCRCTERILLADWFKTLITGQGLPGDLADDMRGSGFIRQYDNTKSNGVARPADLPNTDMRFAFEPQ